MAGFAGFTNWPGMKLSGSSFKAVSGGVIMGAVMVKGKLKDGVWYCKRG